MNASSPKRVLLNLMPISKGGGLQNALSFLDQLSHMTESEQWLIACKADSEINRFCSKVGLAHVEWPGTKLGRLHFDLFGASKLARKEAITSCLTLFGPPPILHQGVRTFSGFAYSNIIQSEVPFWDFLPPGKRWLKKLQDFARLYMCMRADDIILETEFLAVRARQGIFRDKQVHVIQMAPSSLVLSGLGSKKSVKASAGGVTRILYLSGAHPNKRIHLLAPVFSALNNGERKFCLVTTLPTSAYAKIVFSAFDRVGEGRSIENIGSVPADDVGQLLATVHGVVNVALLESFSNNWVEAWAAGIPLFVTDADWSRASCGQAATYLDLSTPELAAKKIFEVYDSLEGYEKTTSAGEASLQTLPAAGERVRQYVHLVEGVRSGVKNYS